MKSVSSASQNEPPGLLVFGICENNPPFETIGVIMEIGHESVTFYHRESVQKIIDQLNHHLNEMEVNQMKKKTTKKTKKKTKKTTRK